MKLTEQEIQAIKDLGWSIDIREDGTYILTNYSPCGGELIIEGVKTKEEIIDRCAFDPNEEFKVWYGAGRGEPSNPDELWKDCLAMEKMYNDLKALLSK